MKWWRGRPTPAPGIVPVSDVMSTYDLMRTIHMALRNLTSLRVAFEPGPDGNRLWVVWPGTPGVRWTIIIRADRTAGGVPATLPRHSQEGM